MFGYAGNHFRIGLGRINFPAALAQVENYLAELYSESDKLFLAPAL
jgi:hypothetical protein